MADFFDLFAQNQIPVTREQYDKLAAYAALLAEENRRQNLTAVRDEAAVWERHLLDSAVLMRFLPVEKASVVDLGTGGGIPGIPLAILRPDLTVTLLDSELHKIEFCARAVERLGLSARAVCGRAEELAHTDAFRGQFDLAVSRAMAAGSMLCELAIPMLKTGGALFSMKGRAYDPAAERFAEACEALGAEVEATAEYTLCGEQKHLIICRKTQDTPAQYPRRFAKIKRSPL